MKRKAAKTLMWLFGVGAIGGLAVFLSLFQSSPGPLAAPHAKAIPGPFAWSCKKCHAEEGLDAGCLACHAEIAAQLAQDSGYHAYLHRQKPTSCHTCHPDHQGADFPLVSAISWQGRGPTAFDHPHVDFGLSGKHDGLACGKCHGEKRQDPFSMPDFPDQPRPSTMLGLEQSCVTCHEDPHGSGELTRDCTKCHSQEAFKPAPFFNHDPHYVLEGSHAKATCTACHQKDEESPPGRFGRVKGKSCTDCHESPHRFAMVPQDNCQDCHAGADATWAAGQRGIDPQLHAMFGFPLGKPHDKAACASCHPAEQAYNLRYPDPAAPDYARRPGQCEGCHKDPHGAQFFARQPACLACHLPDRFVPSHVDPARHAQAYPLLGAHLAVACNQCHVAGSEGAPRRFAGTPTACKACHADPHGGQFAGSMLQNDCTVCHLADSSSFRIMDYQHRGDTSFFLGRGHRSAACGSCHSPSAEDRPIQYAAAPTTCNACHRDAHRGQFRIEGQTRCERCHASSENWNAAGFLHDRDAAFALKGAHEKVGCSACHLPVPQPDGAIVVQYRPLTTRCEDCHALVPK